MTVTDTKRVPGKCRDQRGEQRWDGTRRTAEVSGHGQSGVSPARARKGRGEGHGREFEDRMFYAERLGGEGSWRGLGGWELQACVE